MPQDMGLLLEEKKMEIKGVYGSCRCCKVYRMIGAGQSLTEGWSCDIR